MDRQHLWSPHKPPEHLGYHPGGAGGRFLAPCRSREHWAQGLSEAWGNASLGFVVGLGPGLAMLRACSWRCTQESLPGSAQGTPLSARIGPRLAACKALARVPPAAPLQPLFGEAAALKNLVFLRENNGVFLRNSCKPQSLVVMGIHVTPAASHRTVTESRPRNRICASGQQDPDRESRAHGTETGER